jgi:gluconolactonase
MKKLPLILAALFFSAFSARAQDVPLSEILIDGENWKLVDNADTESTLASDSAGTVYFAEKVTHKIRIRTAAGEIKTLVENIPFAFTLAGPDPAGRLIVATKQKIFAVDVAGKLSILLEGYNAGSIAMLRSGAFYFIELGAHDILFVDAKPGSKPVVGAKGLSFRAPALAIWPDEGTLVMSEDFIHGMWALRIEPDGSLTHVEKYFNTVREVNGELFGMQLACDSKGRTYLASAAGIQMYDTQGRLSGVIAPPEREPVTGVCFGGEKLDELFVTCGGKLFHRKLKVAGVKAPPAAPKK